MAYDPKRHSGRLKRLDSVFYTGAAWVHWTMTIQDRKTDWLTECLHARIREALLHSLARDHLICPVSCLMPDHGHFLLGGLRRDSDQRLAIRLFRREWNRLLQAENPQLRLDLQAYDHVLREEENRRDAFEQLSHYILGNPVRAGLVETFPAWPAMGCLAPGYPDLDPRSENFWDRFWKIYGTLRDWEGTGT